MDVAGGRGSTGDDAGAPAGSSSSPHAAKRRKVTTQAIRRRAMDVVTVPAPGNSAVSADLRPFFMLSPSTVINDPSRWIHDEHTLPTTHDDDRGRS